jgi:hypothetical protein
MVAVNKEDVQKTPVDYEKYPIHQDGKSSVFVDRTNFDNVTIEVYSWSSIVVG